MCGIEYLELEMNRISYEVYHSVEVNPDPIDIPRISNFLQYDIKLCNGYII